MVLIYHTLLRPNISVPEVAYLSTMLPFWDPNKNLRFTPRTNFRYLYAPLQNLCSDSKIFMCKKNGFFTGFRFGFISRAMTHKMTIRH